MLRIKGLLSATTSPTKTIFGLLIFGLAVSVAAAASAPIRLWPGTAPDDPSGIPAEVAETTPGDPAAHTLAVTRITNVTVPTITIYQPDPKHDTGAAVVVCPGGAYHHLAIDKEGTEVCQWLNSIGVTGVLLKYRVPQREGFPRYRLPLEDAQRALGMLRLRAGELGIDPRRIGIIGFSAGGNLAAVLSNNHEKRLYPRVDGADEQSCRPDFAMVIYPGWLSEGGRGSRGIAPKLPVSKERTPPTFLVQAEDDGANVENSLNYYFALQAAKVPAEMHLYPKGGHGYGLRQQGDRVNTWPDRAAEWLRDLGVLVVQTPADSPANASDTITIAADNPAIRYSGRTEGMGTAKVTFGYSGDRVRLRFQGSSSVGAKLDDDSGNNYAMVWIDGQPGRKFRLNARDGFYPLADGLGNGEHTIEVVRVTECNFGLTHFRGFILGKGAKALEWRSAHDRKIEFIGDSITCGYGVEVDDPKLRFTPATENFCLGYSALTARRLDADYLVVARSGIGMVRNYDGPRDGSEDTMPQIYPHTFYLQPTPDWDWHRFTPDVVCVNLGTNDFSTTGVNVEKFVAAYAKFLAMLLERYPDAQIVVLQGPMANGEGLKSALKDAIKRQSQPASKRVHYFALTPQGASGYGADYHPSRAQSRISADELTAFLSGLMNWH